MFRKLLGHVSVYSFGNLLVTAAGLISFPILTRMFSVSEYGTLSLVSATLAFLVALGKLGFQHAIVRLYGEVRAGKSSVSIPTFVSTAVLSMGMAGLAVAAVWLLIAKLFAFPPWNNPALSALPYIVAALVVIRVLDSAFTNLLRVQERSVMLTGYSVVKRYLGLLLVLGFLFYLSKTLLGFYWATVISELVVLIALAAWMFRTDGVDPQRYSRDTLRVMLSFGIPMIWFEVCGIILQLGDRYVIQLKLDEESVGLYSAAYNLCDYVQIILIQAVAQAVMPTYLRIWQEQGAEATEKFINRFLRIYAGLALPVVAGMAAVGHEVIELLASEKYIASAVIIPFVIAGMAIDGITAVAGAGLYIQKKGKTIVMLVAGCAVLNVALNYILLPRMGILGAALATLVSYTVLASSSLLMGRRWLRVRLPGLYMVKYGALSAVMYLAVTQIVLSSQLGTLVVRVICGALLYGILVYLCDEEARRTADVVRKSLRAAFSTGRS